MRLPVPKLPRVPPPVRPRLDEFSMRLSVPKLPLDALPARQRQHTRPVPLPILLIALVAHRAHR